MVPPSHFLKDGSSLNCLNNSVSSANRSIMTRRNAASCSIGAVIHIAMASRTPQEKSASLGAGSFGIRKLRKVDSFSYAESEYGRMGARSPWLRTNALALPLKSICPSSSRSAS